MKRLYQQTRGVSEIVGYVLLVAIAVGLSVLVFAFLRSYIVRSDPPQCPESESVSLILQNYACDNDILNLTLINKGKWKIDGAYVRIGEFGRTIKTPIYPTTQVTTTGPILFIDVPEVHDSLMPNVATTLSFTPSTSTGGRFNIQSNAYNLEVQPVIYIKGNIPALCQVVTQVINCSAL